MISEFFWRIFETTGSVAAYILYKHMVLTK
ncbi:MAG: YqzL family protein [Caldicoprobacterales bacterium]|jgi:hypothetical protein|nr:YqzL family protein [Clostridiales bacterium]